LDGNGFLDGHVLGHNLLVAVGRHLVVPVLGGSFIFHYGFGDDNIDFID
jgi:hypothetical protein